MKLMFLHPVDYGRKAEELLWRKVYYEVIQLIKTNKKAGIAGWGGQPAGPWVRLSKRLLCLEMCRLSTKRCWVRAELTAEFSQKHRCQGLGGTWKAHPAQRGSSTQTGAPRTHPGGWEPPEETLPPLWELSAVPLAVKGFFLMLMQTLPHPSRHPLPLCCHQVSLRRAQLLPALSLHRS